MTENDPELLNTVYREISEALGMDAAMVIYQMFRGQQISFPTRFFNPSRTGNFCGGCGTQRPGIPVKGGK